MKLLYIVYREENVMVFQSQVLDYLKLINEMQYFDSIELIIYRHEKNLFNKNKVHSRVYEYIRNVKSFSTLPLLTRTQLDLSVFKLKNYIGKKYNKDDKIIVVCRGDLAAYVGSKSFKKYDNSRILYDNRGLAYEESVLSYGNNLIHKVNRNVKKFALNYSKNNVDIYNFVTTNMRKYMINNYDFNEKLLHTIVPTLSKIKMLNKDKLALFNNEISKEDNDIIITFVGSTQTWQSHDSLSSFINLICKERSDIKFLILSNANKEQFNKIEEKYIDKIIIKSVKHDDVMYYLSISDYGLIIRDNNIINKVAAPTKISEYITVGLPILYSGEVGILTDIKNLVHDYEMINIDNDYKWIKKLKKKDKLKAHDDIIKYFDAEVRVQDTLEAINKSFINKKVR